MMMSACIELTLGYIARSFFAAASCPRLTWMARSQLIRIPGRCTPDLETWWCSTMRHTLLRPKTPPKNSYPGYVVPGQAPP